MNRHVGVVGVLLVGLVGLAGCTEPDTTPVPTVAAAPWACTGVPMRAIELMSGREDLQVEETGGWADEHEFFCFVDSHDGQKVLTVEYSYTGSAGSEETIVPRLAEAEGSIALDGGDIPGGGYAYPSSTGESEAEWVSGTWRLIVSLERSAGGDRDPVADVGALLVSMLPWAFGDERPPQP